MKQKKAAERVRYYLAIDVGASLGRHIVGYEESGRLVTDTVYSFASCIEDGAEGFVWNTEKLLEEVLSGIAEAFVKYPDIQSISLCAEGGDYVLLADGEQILPVYTSCDARVGEVIGEIFENLSAKILYTHTGSQLLCSTPLCRLYADKEWGRLDGASDFLMIAEYIAYKLTGSRVRELTGGAATGMVNINTLRYDRKIWSSLGLPIALDAPLCMPGTPVGKLKPDIAKRVGGEASVVLSVSDRVASATEVLDGAENAPYVFLGERSVLGIKTPFVLTDDKSFDSGFSNLGGTDSNRYQKSISDVRITERLRRELCPEASESDISGMAEESGFFDVFDVNDSSFFAPPSMKDAIDGYMQNNGKAVPESIGDYLKCAYMSIGYCYGVSVADLEYNTGKVYSKLYMIGGEENPYLKRVIEKYTGKRVVELPAESSAIGNLKIQMKKVKN